MAKKSQQPRTRIAGFGKTNHFEEDDLPRAFVDENALALADIIEVIRSHYQPAKSTADEGVLSFKTWELSKRVKDIYPHDYTDKEIYQAMVSAGFEPTTQGELELVWLIKPV